MDVQLGLLAAENSDLKARVVSLETELRFTHRSTLAKVVAQAVNNLIKYGGFVLIALYAYKSIHDLAGKVTTSNISLNGNFNGSLNVNPAIVLAIGILVGIAGVVYGLFERREKQKVIRHFESRKSKWEEQVDPGRKSSELSSDGTTRLEDI